MPRPAPSQSSAAWAHGTTWVLISFRCSFITSVLTVGMMIATARAGQAR